MKKILIFIALNLLWIASYSQYTTPNNFVSWTLDSLVTHSSGVVVKTDDHYEIFQNINLSPTDTLLITTQDTVKLAQDIEITIQGTLIANPIVGRVVFTAINVSHFYKTLRFENTNNSILRKCLIEYGNGIKLIESSITIDSCILRNNSKDFNSGAIDIFQSSPTIQHCEIYNNQTAAISSGANAASAPLIEYNTIYSNVTSNINKPQINLGNTNNDTIKIIGNTITGFYEMAGGIAVSTLAGGSLNCIIDSNLIENNRYGFAAIGYNIKSIVNNNIVHGNNIQNNPQLGGSGLNFYGDTTNTAIVKNNIITDNLWGVTIQLNALPNLGDITTDSLCIGNNQLYNNGNNGEIFAIYNNTPQNISAENNYWGTYDIDSVELFIFHQNDSSALGMVDYLPIFPEPSAVSLISKENSSYSLIEKISPNPFTHYFEIEFLEDASINQPLEIRLYQLNGNELFCKTTNQKRFRAYTSHLSDGVYILVVTNGVNSDAIKLVKN